VQTFFQLAAVLLLVLANAFFVAAEFSIITLRRTRVEELVSQRHPLARSLRAAVNNPSPFIATTQLGITMASLALGWIGEPSLAAAIDPLLGFFPQNVAQITAHSLATVLSFLVITAVDIVLGELIPKNLALQRPEAVSFVIVQPMLLFQAVLRPFVSILTSAGTLGLRAFGLTSRGGHGLVYSVDELRMIVAASRQAGVLDESEEDLIERAFHFAELRAHEVMVPRTDVVAVPVDATISAVLERAAQTKREQFPVYESTVDNIVGVVFLVDLVRGIGRVDVTRVGIRPFVREALVVPESLGVDDLIDRMRQHRTHLAILVDEYGGTAGLVKLVDILERVVGQVPDEFSANLPDISRLADGTIEVDGLTSLLDVNEEIGLVLTSDVYDTIGGYVLGEIGRRPTVGDTVTQDGTSFEVTAVDGLRVARIRLRPTASVSDPSESTEPIGG
jgi:CBS domain containing-hemolysin-like protein